MKKEGSSHANPFPILFPKVIATTLNSSVSSSIILDHLPIARWRNEKLHLDYPTLVKEDINDQDNYIL